MKKMFLVLIAGVMAFTFSAFTNVKTQDDFLYLDDQSQWQQVPANIDVPSLCPEGNVIQCQITINGKLRYIFNSDHSQYKRN